MSYTISTHNGSRVSRQHNLRNRHVTDKEKHIDRDGIHATWLDIKPSDAYHKLFDKSISEYNLRQIDAGHPERQIKNYFKKICDDAKKHPVYEMILTIGRVDNHPPMELSRKILKKFCKTWTSRNPNLILIGAYFHADEEGACHCHLDYIPVAHHMSRGPTIQTALVKALNEQNLFTDSIHDTAQIKFERAQNAYLEELCRKEGLDIEHPHIEHAQHLETVEYKQQMRIKELEQENAELEQRINLLIDKHNDIVDTISELEEGALELAEEVIEKSVQRDRGELIH